VSTSVACTNLAAGTCTGVGGLSDGDGGTVNIVDRVIKTTTDLLDMGTGLLLGVACRATTNCVAVGYTGACRPTSR
jgi:hypothetical protein